MMASNDKDNGEHAFHSGRQILSQPPEPTAILLLTSDVKICNAATISIRDHLKTPANVTSLTDKDKAVLQKDFLSLLALVYSSTTKLSLTLKPTSPAYKSSFDPLKDISNQISAISHCVCLFAPDHGMTLMREVASIAEDVIQSVRALLEIFLENETYGVEHAGNEYLVRTGAVHDLISKARAPGGVSANNLASVRKKWKQDYDAMDDGLNEISEMIKGAQASTRDDDLEVDGWDELGLQSSTKMDQTELERAKKVVVSITSFYHYLIVFVSIGTLHFAFIKSVAQTNFERHLVSSRGLANTFLDPYSCRIGYVAVTLIHPSR